MPEVVKLPPEFSDLQDLANHFALSDDLKRAEAAKAATPVERNRLVESLRPRYGAINAYLDEHDDASAHLLGRLAEVACEVQVEIES